ncbi:MAG: hypothetical protein WC495_00780 [Patescibacteria group bacterium]
MDEIESFRPVTPADQYKLVNRDNKDHFHFHTNSCKKTQEEDTMSKRSCITLILLAILLALPWTINAKEWPLVGANPTTTAAWVTLNKMDLDPSVIKFTQNNFPETTWVVKGMVFNEISEGIGVIKRNVRVTFDSTKALVWHTGDVDVYYVLYCSNVGWKSACPGSIATPAPSTPPDSIVTPLAPREGATEFLPGFPDWFEALMMILIGLIITLLALLILWLLWRGLVAVNDSFRNRNVPPTTPASLAPPKTPPASTTGPTPSPATATPPAAPTPGAPVDDLDALKQMVQSHENNQEVADKLNAMIQEKITAMTAANTAQNEELAKIAASMKK